MKTQRPVGRRIARARLDRQRFFQLAERLRSASDRDELERVKSELARLTFGSPGLKPAHERDSTRG